MHVTMAQYARLGIALAFVVLVSLSARCSEDRDPPTSAPDYPDNYTPGRNW